MAHENHNDNLVPEPSGSILDAVSRVIDDKELAHQIAQNPSSAGMLEESYQKAKAKEQAAMMQTENVANTEEFEGVTLNFIDEIGRVTAKDVKEALHQVMDPELGVDVVDLGLVYGIEIDHLGRAILTMTLTTPACPLTDLIEDECASVLAGLVEEFRVDWTWTPAWNVDMITEDGAAQLAALGFNLNNLPRAYA
ncbi:metal-sulfur cluster assembly factor [Alloscardovia criceti]|uniref:metal-sulfur cluster assembly factor n=1 Tax=Alloscardovia criceti TaxID=356828 RepID=UPI0003700E86|nr:metal-sulfur cluster assembly factor [Alloscardovia criceti]